MQTKNKVDTVGTVGPERGDAASLPDEAVSSTDRSSTGPAAPADSTMSDDWLGLDVDPALAELGEEYSRRTLAGETVDVDELLAARPPQAEAFRKLLPILQGLAELEPVNGADKRHNDRRRSAPITPAKERSSATFHRPRDRPRRHGGRLRGPAARHRPGRPEGDAAGRRRRPEGPAAVRSWRPRSPACSSTRASCRCTPWASSATSLLRDAVYRRGQPRRPDRRAARAGRPRREAPEILSPGDGPGLALGLLTGRFAAAGREAGSVATAGTTSGERQTTRRAERQPGAGRRDWPSRKEGSHVGWRRTIRRIVRPTAHRYPRRFRWASSR